MSFPNDTAQLGYIALIAIRHTSPPQRLEHSHQGVHSPNPFTETFSPYTVGS
jgi:hypothetical protein